MWDLPVFQYRWGTIVGHEIQQLTSHIIRSRMTYNRPRWHDFSFQKHSQRHLAFSSTHSNIYHTYYYTSVCYSQLYGVMRTNGLAVTLWRISWLSLHTHVQMDTLNFQLPLRNMSEKGDIVHWANVFLHFYFISWQEIFNNKSRNAITRIYLFKNIVM